MAYVKRAAKHVLRCRRYGPISLYYSKIYSGEILRSKPFESFPCGSREVHMLCCQKDLMLALWSLKSFLHFSGMAPRIVFYDDGSLSEDGRILLSTHFKKCDIIRRDQFGNDMTEFLRSYPHSLRFSRIPQFYCSLKLFGPMLYSKGKSVLYIDADVLFFREPLELLNLMESNDAFYLNDYQNSYTDTPKNLQQNLGVKIDPSVNAGLFHLPTTHLKSGLDLAESYFQIQSNSKSNANRSVNRHEQTMVALLLSRANAKGLNSDYQISRDALTNETVCHHFLSDGSRAHFFSKGLRRLRRAGFLNTL